MSANILNFVIWEYIHGSNKSGNENLPIFILFCAILGMVATKLSMTHLYIRYKMEFHALHRCSSMLTTYVYFSRIKHTRQQVYAGELVGNFLLYITDEII